MDAETLRLARIVWDYLHLGSKPVAADVIVVLGTNDLRVAEFAANLYHDGFGQLMVFTGGVAHQGDLLATSWGKSEAEMFADVAVARGVLRESILLEQRAVNTAENLRFTRALLRDHDIVPRSVVLAVKPFMQRRTWATKAVEWPEMQATLASPKMTFDEYFTPELPPEKVVHIMVGDLQRVWVYARRGWSAPQVIPPEVRMAYEGLVARGFTRQLIPE
jgi:uncharacterized SAM-binding protein YcdF (DUF218 family)